ncbi:hypothetical protein ESCOMM224M_22285 [Escherichia coli]|nr:ATP-binding protein [Escherichia coli]EFN5068357.1 ATP-binding protein [Escherichia coli]
MRLRKLKLKNFRGYRNSTEIIIDESMTGTQLQRSRPDLLPKDENY